MSDEKNSLVETKVMNEDKVNDEALSLQVVNDEIITMDSESMQEVIEEISSEGNVSIAGVKRTYRYSDEVEIEVSTSPKRACTTSSSEKGANDHTYCIKSPHRLRNQVNDLTDKIESLKKKVKSSKRKINRRDKKVSTLASVVSELKENNLINNDCATMLETTYSGVSRELMKRLVSQKKKKNPGAYPPELRSFAMTLKFYSTKAYNYVRKSFDLGLPHVSVIRSWYSSMNGEPGFTKDAMTALKAKVLAAKRDNQEVVCALMLDEMSIRKHVEWDGKQFRGYVDLGTGINDDSLPEATDALVFMAVVPCGCFLVNGLTGHAGESQLDQRMRYVISLPEQSSRTFAIICI